MHANQPTKTDSDDVVVPIAKGIEPNQGSITEKLRLLVELFTHNHSQTDARLETLESNARQHDTHVLDLESRSDSLESSLEDIDARADVGKARLDFIEPKVGNLVITADDLDSRTTVLGQKQHETQLRADGLENRLKWTSVIAGHSLFILAVVAGLSYWYSGKNLDTASLAISKSISTTKEQLSANLDKQIATVYFTTSERLDQKISDTDSKISAKFDGQLTALDTRLSDQVAFLESERTRLLNLNQEGTRKIDMLQQQLSQNTSKSTELQKGHDALTRSFENTTDSLLLTDAKLQTEIAAIKARLSSNDGGHTAVMDMGALRDESWLIAHNSRGFAIQLVGAYRKQELANFIGRHGKSLPLQELSYFKKVRKGRDWYILLYGDYQGFQQALNSLEGLPRQLQTNGPYIRTYKSVKKSISR